MARSVLCPGLGRALQVMSEEKWMSSEQSSDFSKGLSVISILWVVPQSSWREQVLTSISVSHSLLSFTLQRLLFLSMANTLSLIVLFIYFLFFSLYVYAMCATVCVCVRERKKERTEEHGREHPLTLSCLSCSDHIQTFLINFLSSFVSFFYFYFFKCEQQAQNNDSMLASPRLKQHHSREFLFSTRGSRRKRGDEAFLRTHLIKWIQRLWRP